MAERFLKRLITNQLDYVLAGSNPAAVVPPPISPYGTIGSAIFL